MGTTTSTESSAVIAGDPATVIAGKKIAKVLRLARRAIECHVDCQTCIELLPDIDKALADLAKRIPGSDHQSDAASSEAVSEADGQQQ